MVEIHRWTVFEVGATSARDYPNPFWDVDVSVRFTAPSGRTLAADAFWDGRRTWRVRFSPDEVGEWRWACTCPDANDEGLQGSGTFTCVPYEGDNPHYETHLSYHIQRRFTDREVRRAAYWSLLVSPPAGVSYGHNAIWTWSERPEVPEGHDRLGLVPPWHEGIDAPGVRSMAILQEFFDALPWTTLCPSPDLLVEQPGREAPERFVAAARTEDGRLGVLYLPVGGEARLDLSRLNAPSAARWFNPRTGEWMAAQVASTFTAPDNDDWGLCIGKGDKSYAPSTG